MRLKNWLLVVVAIVGSTVIGYAASGEGTITTQFYDLQIKTSGLGNYEITIDAYEKPFYATIPIISDFYFESSSQKLVAEVDNNTPNARYDAIGTTKIDIGYNNSYFSNDTAFRTQLNNIVNELNSLPGLDVRLVNVDTYETYTTTEQVPYRYIKSVGSNDMGYTGDKTYVSGNWNNTTINIAKMKQDGLNGGTINAGWYVAIQISGGSYTYVEPNTDRGYDGCTVTISGSTSGVIATKRLYSKGSAGEFTITDSGMLEIDGTLYPIQNLTVSVENHIVGETDIGAYGYGVVLALGQWATGYRTVTTTKQRPTYFIEGLQKMSWRQDSIKFALYANHAVPTAYDGTKAEILENEYFIKEMSDLLSNQLYYVGVGSTTNKSQFDTVVDIYKELVVGDNNSSLYVDGVASASTAAQQIYDFILSKIPDYDASIKWVLVNQDIIWTTTYEDRENDPPLNIFEHYESDLAFLNTWSYSITSERFEEDKILAERWRFRHRYSYYDNDLGIVNYHNSWMPDPITNFDKTGLYRINYKRKDNPFYPNMDIGYAFDAYRKWSKDYDYMLETTGE